MNLQEILERIQGLGNAKWVVLTGGNPALYDLTELVGKLKEFGYKIICETQGSVFQEWFRDVDMLVLSPKPPSSGMRTDWDTLRRCLDSNRESVLKIVIFDDTDLAYATMVHNIFSEPMLFLQVGRKQGDDEMAVIQRLRWLTQRALRISIAGLAVLPQLHFLIWGNCRGV